MNLNKFYDEDKAKEIAKADYANALQELKNAYKERFELELEHKFQIFKLEKRIKECEEILKTTRQTYVETLKNEKIN